MLRETRHLPDFPLRAKELSLKALGQSNEVKKSSDCNTLLKNEKEVTVSLQFCLVTLSRLSRRFATCPRHRIPVINGGVNEFSHQLANINTIFTQKQAWCVSPGGSPASLRKCAWSGGSSVTITSIAWTTVMNGTAVSSPVRRRE
ncbi:hypothetical protein E2C01_102133 [Portunus trituberculatus]|uniref:Uncharacterized protein n=1 Tax=Portunus trituberculatus TaxID=210409 RepID=A0A5B7KHR5_PORTR|nr:hypothetical protein [Portunus trituberculatus]